MPAYGNNENCFNVNISENLIVDDGRIDDNITML